METFWILIWLYFLVFILVLWLVFAYLRKRRAPTDKGHKEGGDGHQQHGHGHGHGHSDGGDVLGARDLGFFAGISANGAAVSNGAVSFMPKGDLAAAQGVSKAFTPGSPEEAPTLIAIPSEATMNEATLSMPDATSDIKDQGRDEKGSEPSLTPPTFTGSSSSPSSAAAPASGPLVLTPGDHFVVACTQPLRIGMTLPSGIETKRYKHPRFEIYLIDASSSSPLMNTPLWRSDPLSGLVRDFDLVVDLPRLPEGTALMVVLTEGSKVLSTRVIHVDRACATQVLPERIELSASSVRDLNLATGVVPLSVELSALLPGQSELLRAQLLRVDSGQVIWTSASILSEPSPRWTFQPPRSLFGRGKPAYELIIDRRRANDIVENLYRGRMRE